jgi:DNA repair protein RAD50
MTTLSQLSIQGVRSYSHERAETIKFLKPLTIIVGANGCGKTTIIESLKFACTGQHPPLSNNGSSFVHDPKVSK